MSEEKRCPKGWVWSIEDCQLHDNCETCTATVNYD